MAALLRALMALARKPSFPMCQEPRACVERREWRTAAALCVLCIMERATDEACFMHDACWVFSACASWTKRMHACCKILHFACTGA